MLQVLGVDGLCREHFEDRRTALEVVHGLEERSDVEGDGAVLVHKVSEPREPKDREGIVWPLCHADHEGPHGLCSVSAAGFSEGLEDSQRRDGLVGERLHGREHLALRLLGGHRGGEPGGPLFPGEGHEPIDGEELPDHAAVHLGVLPAIEGGEVEAEGGDAHEQALDELHTRLRAAVLVEAGRDESQVRLELSGSGIGTLVPLPGGTEARVNALKREPVRHFGVAVGHLLEGLWEPPSVVID